MIDHLKPFRVLMSGILLTASVWFALPSPSGMASPGGMLSMKDESGSVQDALIVRDDPAVTENRIAPDGSTRQSPGTVALISAILPGYGQIYNHSVWKLPIYYGLLGYFATSALHDSDQYNKYRDLYRADPTAAGASDAAEQRDSYRKKRNLQIALLCVTYALGIVDAYVDAQLYDFDKIIDEKVGAAVPPGQTTTLFSFSRKF
ncbi:MAG: hypothetical protein HGB29_05740 [Chlorobiaceae bacterium]|nr:hypothetical protein [Chlorobiaceae bacterium]NTW74350.1 hypothetical protein [Chlorobiaceae bacterium]